MILDIMTYWLEISGGWWFTIGPRHHQRAKPGRSRLLLSLHTNYNRKRGKPMDLRKKQNTKLEELFLQEFEMKLECLMWEILNLCRHEILLGFRTHEIVLCFIWCLREQVCLGIFFLSLRFRKLGNVNLPIFLKVPKSQNCKK